MKKSRTVAHPVAVESRRHLPLVDLLVDARMGPQVGLEGVVADIEHPAGFALVAAAAFEHEPRVPAGFDEPGGRSESPARSRRR